MGEPTVRTQVVLDFSGKHTSLNGVLESTGKQERSGSGHPSVLRFDEVQWEMLKREAAEQARGLRGEQSIDREPRTLFGYPVEVVK